MDCDKLAHSKIPYALTMKTDKKETISQNYRADQMFLTKFMPMDGGNIAKITIQGPFLLSRKLSEEKEYRFSYSSISTSEPIYERKPKFYDISSTFNSNGESKPLGTIRHYLSYVGVEPYSIGPCVFQTVHYTDEEEDHNRKGGVRSRKEVWFSPDLGTPVKFKSSLYGYDGNSTMTTNGEATAITTDFEPYKFP